MKPRKQTRTISRIMVPTDFSPDSAEALEYAIALAKQLKADLILAHVIEPFPYNLVEGMAFSDYGERLTPPVQRLLNHQSKRAIKEKIPVKTRLIEGAPFREIIKMAKRERADLIVMGTHGRTGIDHLLAGSVAEKVVRLSPCPVLTVRSVPAASKPGSGKARSKSKGRKANVLKDKATLI